MWKSPAFKTLFIGLCCPFLVSWVLPAQSNCGPETIRKAREQFQIGNFDQLFSRLYPCIEDGFSDKEKVEAYRLIALSFLAKDEAENAAKAVGKLLKINPDFRPDFLDSPFFIRLIEDQKLQLQDMISIGTRTTGSNAEETPVPVDIITREQLERSPHMELGQLLQHILPSFSANHHTLTDGTDHIDPASLRGLGPDQILVLVNGKRRHSCSIVNTLGSFGRGAVNIDLNAFPVSMIQQVEILRDGAAAQYGSDAIAGVINIVLRQQEGLEVGAAGGGTLSGDGGRMRYDLNYGVSLKDGGFLNVGAELFSRQGTDRSGLYTGTIYHEDESEDANDPRTANFNRDVMNLGDAQAFTPKLFLNSSFVLNDRTRLYAFGGMSFRKGMGTGYYRFPKNEERVVATLYPDGFLPEIRPRIQDNALSAGIIHQMGRWKLDLSHSYGNNAFDFDITNSNNASMGNASPTSFYSGGYFFGQHTTNLDFAREFNDFGIIKNPHLAFGAEFRMNTFRIIAGDEASWQDYGDTTSTGEPKVGGAQVFPGIQPPNQLKALRDNASIYLDLESKIGEKIRLNVAGRYERYSDFGGTFNGKIAGTFKPFQKLFFRGAVSTGFRAPSLHQLYLSNTSTQISNNQLIQVGIFNNSSQVTKAFGIPELKQEVSLNISAGASFLVMDNLRITADLYQIMIQDRIVLSGFFTNTDSTVAGILAPFGVSSAQFFTNAVDTRTRGIDLRAIYGVKFPQKQKLDLSITGNISATRIRGNLKVSEELAGQEETLFSREEKARLEYYQPADKWVVSARYTHPKWDALLSFVRYGKVEYLHPDDPSADEVFSPKWLTDLVIGYTFSKTIRISAGGSNIFNVFPDLNTNDKNIDQGRFVYNNTVTQFGANGAFYYGRISAKF